VAWEIQFQDDFAAEFLDLPQAVQDELTAKLELLQRFGPQLQRPNADTLNDSKHANMKELRFKAANGVWRVAFAFDPEKTAIILVAGDKSGGSEKRFYRSLIRVADNRYDQHLEELESRAKE
jgi:hypothetical protein